MDTQTKVAIIVAIIGGLFAIFAASIPYLASPILHPTIDHTKVSFSDYFTDDDSGWTTSENIYYKDNMLNFRNTEIDFDISSKQTKFTPPNDFIIEYDMTIKNSPALNDGSGVCLRRVDNNDYYRFKISNTGQYSFRKIVNGEYTDLIPWTKSRSIKPGNALNTIKISCIGSNFVFYINGVKVNHCEDTTFASGKIALSAGHADEAENTVVSFDNLKVWSIID